MDDKRDGFVIYSSYAEKFEDLTDEQFGKLIRSVCDYQKTGVMPKIEDKSIRIAFKVIKYELDVNSQKYEEICEKRKKAIQARWEKKTESDEDTKNTNEYKCIEVNTNDTDKDKEKEKDKVKVKEKDKEKDKENNINVIHNSVSYTRAPEEGQGSDFKIYGICNNIRMTDDEMNELKKMYPALFSDYIDRVSLHKKSEGREYNDDFATILKWIRKDKDKEKKNQKEDCINDRSKYGDDEGLFENYKAALDDAPSE